MPSEHDFIAFQIRVFHFIAAIVACIAFCEIPLRAALVSFPLAQNSLFVSQGIIRTATYRYSPEFPYSIFLNDTAKTEIHLIVASDKLKNSIGRKAQVGWYSSSKNMNIGVWAINSQQTLLTYADSMAAVRKLRVKMVGYITFWVVAFGAAALFANGGPRTFAACSLILIFGVILSPFLHRGLAFVSCLVYLMYLSQINRGIRSKAYSPKKSKVSMLHKQAASNRKLSN